MPWCPSRALFASECSALVTFKGVCCQMHMIMLFCGLCLGPAFSESGHAFSLIKCYSRELKIKPRVVDYFGNLQMLRGKNVCDYYNSFPAAVFRCLRRPRTG